MTVAETIQSLGRLAPVRFAITRINRVLSHLGPWPVRVGNATLHAATLDRLVALFLLRKDPQRSYQARLWQHCAEPGAVVLDVGSNLGLFAMMAAPLVGEEGLVWAFEADPLNRDLLERTLLKNAVGNIRVVGAAVTDRCGRVRFTVREDHRGDCHITASPDSGGRFVEIPATTLDATLGDTPRVDLIKLDIQGAEALALAGAGRIIAASPRLRVFSEFWPEGLKRCGSDPEAYLAAWRQHGFSMARIDEKGARLEVLDDAALLAGVTERHRYDDLLIARDDELARLQEVH